ncbi:MAG TPA: DNA topoisomerase, partial [Candidatus Absconditabacterales bacterium]|nr:DNA topoisomerase [Candidatus Absconditabacterales bacterium]
YTEATLVKALEQKGIGRPSTYASTISTIQERGYVMKDEGKLKPTEVAYGVNDFLEEHFRHLMNYEFTAQMEDKLDDIANGDLNRQTMLQDFYTGFEPQLKAASGGEKIKLGTGKICPKCGQGELIVRFNKNKNRFLGCERYPECDYISETEDVANKLESIKAQYEGQPCPEGGTIVVKMGRFGPFLSSSDYPTVKWIKSPAAFELEQKIGDQKPLCPECGKSMIIRRSKRGPFRGCSGYPDCKGTMNIGKLSK